MAKTIKEELLRPTGNMERFNIIRNHVNFYNNIQVSATYTLPLSIVITHSLFPIIQSALALTIQKQPILSVTIQDEGTKEPKWKRCPSIRLDELIKVIEIDENKSHDEWITAGHRTRLDRVDELPVWRIIFAVPSSTSEQNSEETSFTLAFFPHHGIADGLSATAFHTTFLSSLNTLLQNPHLIATQPIITPKKQPLPDTLEQRAKLPISPWFAIKKIAQTYIFSFPSPKTYTGPPITSSPPSKPPTSNLLTFSLPHSSVKKIVQKCRQQKTTLTSLLTVLVAQCISEIHGPAGYTRFVGQIPFSLRKWTKHSADEMGCFVSGVSPLFSSERKTPKGYISCLMGEGDVKGMWEAARETRGFVERETRSERDQAVGLLVFVGDLKGFFLGKLGGKREHTFEVTNVGVVDGGLDSFGEEGEDRQGGKGKGMGKARFDNMIFSSALCTYGDPYCVSVVSVKGGMMTVGVNWVIGVTEDEHARGLSKWLEQRLSEIAEGYVDGGEIYEEVSVSAIEKGGVGWVWAVAGLVGVVAASWWYL